MADRRVVDAGGGAGGAGGIPLPLLAAGDAELNPADAIADTSYTQQAWFTKGNPNHQEWADQRTPLQQDDLRIDDLSLSDRVPKQELITYRNIPARLLFNFGEEVARLAIELYGSLEASSRTRRLLVQLKLLGRGDTEQAKSLVAKIDQDKLVLESYPAEMQRLKGRVVVTIPQYLMIEPQLLPNPRKASTSSSPASTGTSSSGSKRRR